jgi:hypothetical protein
VSFLLTKGPGNRTDGLYPQSCRSRSRYCARELRQLRAVARQARRKGAPASRVTLHGRRVPEGHAEAAGPARAAATTLPTGARITFGRAESFAAVEDHAVDVITSELCGVGWTRQFGNYPSIYFVEIDNRKGKTDVSWSPRDRVVLAAQGRTYEQEQGFRFAAVMQRFGGHAQTVLPGTTAIMPIVFVNPIPWRSITTARIQSGSAAIPLACDEQPTSSAATTAAPTR